MGKISVKENKNIYQITRESLGLSRAAAALADFDGNGKLNIKDATTIQKKIAGLI